MTNNDQNICVKSIISMIYSVALSCILHILFAIFLTYHLMFYIDNISCYTNNNHKMITLLFPFNNSVINKTLETKYLPEIPSSPELKKHSESEIYAKNKILKNSKKISDTIDHHFCDISNNHSTNINNNHLFSNSSAIESANTTHISPRSHIIRYVHPEYPNRAKALAIEGKLLVMYNINTIGKVEKIRILSAIPPGIFEESVKLSMRRWIYESNKPRQNLTITFKFSLETTEIFPN